MIKSFADKETKKLFEGERNRVPQQIQRRALRKLEALDAVASLEQLGNVPGNNLELFDQSEYAVQSVDGNAYEVEVTDYH